MKFCLKQQKRQKTISIPARYRYGFGKIEHGEFELLPGGKGGANSLLVTRAKKRLPWGGEGENYYCKIESPFTKTTEIKENVGIERRGLYLIL